jgi:hypothetical protein
VVDGFEVSKEAIGSSFALELESESDTELSDVWSCGAEPVVRISTVPQ